MRSTKITKIVLGLLFVTFFLSVLPNKASATVICKQGGKFLSFPGTDSNICRSVQATVASPEETAAYISNPSSSKDLALNAAVEKRLEGSNELECKVSITQCLAKIMYYIGPGIAGYVSYIGAYFFSIVVQLSLNSTAYALNFLSDGWTTVRDLANMSFIFILVYIAMTVMLQAETSGTIKTLAIVVVIALLVNFSFFFTRVVIDMGNILALQFYNAIPNGDAPAINGVKDLSSSLMGASGPQVLLSSDMFKNATTLSKGSEWGALGIFTVIYLSVAAMLWMLFFAFIQVGIKFMLRIVGLWFLLIASPLAFVAKTMKKTEGYFDQWLKKLVEFSLYPAIFLFMFLILTRFAGTVVSGKKGSLLNAISHSFDNVTPDSATSATGVIAAVAIRMGFVLALMFVALKVSDWVVKEGSNVAAKITGGITGRGFGAAASTLGWGGRNTIGRGMNALSKSAAIATGAQQKGLGWGTLWRGAESATKRLGSATYDVRNAPGGGLIKKGVEKYLGTTVDTGKATTEGFAAQAKAAGEKKDKENKERAAIVRDASNQEALKRIAEDVKTGNTHNPTDVSRIRNLNKREIEALKATDIEKIAHLINADKIKTINDSEKYTDEEKTKISTLAEPITKSQKIVADELRKLNDHLVIASSHSAIITAATAPTTTINIAAINNMRNDLNSKMTNLRTNLAGAAPGDADDIKSDMAQIRNGLKSIRELERQMNRVPAHNSQPAQSFVTY